MRHKIYDIASTTFLVLAIFFAGNAVLSVSGCETTDSTVTQAAYDEAVLLVDASAAEAARLRAKPNKTPEEEAALTKAEATITMLQEKLAAAVDAQGNVDPVAGIRILTDFIPPPYNVPAALLAGTIATWLKGRKTRTTFQALVGALNKVKADDSALARVLAENKNALNAAMGPKATAVLRKARKEGKFPIV